MENAETVKHDRIETDKISQINVSSQIMGRSKLTVGIMNDTSYQVTYSRSNFKVWILWRGLIMLMRAHNLNNEITSYRKSKHSRDKPPSESVIY